MNDMSVNIEICAISKNGNGLGSIKDGAQAEKLFEVPFTVPGDLVELDPSENETNKRSLKKLVKPSPLRVSAKCSHFGRCGGCRFQHIPYNGQLAHKEKMVKEVLADHLKEDVVFHPILGAKNLWNYRSKMDYTFAIDEQGKHRLGLIAAGTKGEIIDLPECQIAPKWFSDAVCCVKRWWEGTKLSAYNPKTGTGILRYLTLREGRRSGDRMVILSIMNQASGDLNIRYLEKFVQVLKEFVSPHLNEEKLSVYLRLHQASKGVPSSEYEMQLIGDKVILETISVANGNGETNVFSFEIAPSCFFQPNPQQGEMVVSKILELAKLDKHSVVYDLYCGIGTFGICLSKSVKQVVGIDISSESAALARRNAELNKCENVTIYSGAVRHVLNQVKKREGVLPDVVIVNPPRAGLDPIACMHLSELNAEMLIYYSSNPETLAKDIDKLKDSGYRLKDLQPIDPFPHTNHVASLALLTKEKQGV